MIEIHSVCLNDIHLIDAINDTFDKNIEVFIGIGGSTIDEVKNAISLLKTDSIVLMHGFQNYPTQYKDINFNKVRKIKDILSNFKHGYADHTGWNEPQNQFITLIGGTLGMKFIEKHVTNVYGIERCDWNSAISIDMFNDLIANWKLIEQCFGDGKLELNDAEKKISLVKSKGFKDAYVVAFNNRIIIPVSSAQEMESKENKPVIESHNKEKEIDTDNLGIIYVI